MLHLNLDHCSVPLLRALADECRNQEDIQQILEFKEKEVYKNVAGNIHASEDTLRYLYKKYGEEVEWTLAENETTPQDVLHEIAEKSCQEVAKVLLRNSKLEARDIDILVERCQDAKRLIEVAIYHENVSATTLIKIASWYPELAGDILGTDRVKLVES